MCFPGADSLATLKSKNCGRVFFCIAYQHRSSGALYIDLLIDIVVVVYSTYPGYSFDCSKLFNRVEKGENGGKWRKWRKWGKWGKWRKWRK